MSPSRPKKAVSKKRSASVNAAQQASATDDRVEIDYERLKSLTKLIQLSGIVLVDGGIQSNVDPRLFAGSDGGPKGYTLSLGDARWWIEGNALDVLLGYRVTGQATRSGEKLDLFTVGARFLVSYALPEDTAVPLENRDNLLADLVAANGQINAFPYLRQFVTDATARAGWPPLVLNVFKVPARRPRGLVRMARPWDSGAEDRRS